MNKLIVAGVAALISTAVHAASVSWTSSAIYSPESAKAGTPEKVGITSGVYDMLVTYYSYDTSSGQWTEFLTATTSDTPKKNSKMSTTTSGFEASTQYGMIVRVDTEGYYLETDMALFTVPATADAALGPNESGSFDGFDTAMTFDASKYEQGAGTWYPVPEPTSGMLLLLGMAGLALKRKRA